MKKVIPIKTAEMRIFDSHGDRLYLNAEERQSFLNVARQKPARDRTLCETLHYTGCRSSELIEIRPSWIDLSSSTVTLRTLKKRPKAGKPSLVFRTVPVPTDYLDTLNTAYGIWEAQKSKTKKDAPIWSITRQRVWQITKEIMIEAGIPEAPQRTTKGLRHGYGINAIVQGVPLNMLQKWMGHSSIETTAIYAFAVGKEEQDIAARMWS